MTHITGEEFSHLRRRLPPVVASTEYKDGWPLCWGNSGVDGMDWYLCTEPMPASIMVDVFDMPQDAKVDCQMVAKIINGIRSGDLVHKDEVDAMRAKMIAAGIEA